jgi:hypothetical protein
MRARLTSLIPSPAMAVALAALIAATVGLAVAASSTNTSVIRACANKKTGALRLAKKCHHGEHSVSWSQTGPQGPPGASGETGPQGDQGDQGQAGPGATSFTRSVAVGPTETVLFTLSNGISLTGTCPGSRVVVAVVVTGASGPLQASGTAFGDFGGGPELIPIDENETFGGARVENVTEADIDVVARTPVPSSNAFAHIDFHGSANGASAPCTFWGVVIPAS